MQINDRLFTALQNMVGAFGNGPDAEDFWENWVDAAACDCVNPEHPHTSAQVREWVLQQAQEALAAASVTT